MATSAVYTLQRMADREDALEADEEPAEGAFQTGGRTSWDFTLNLQRVESGATLEVVIESSPTDDEDDWQEVVSFGSQTDTSNSPVEKKSQTVEAGERYLRSRHTTLTGGEVIYEVTATSAFFRLGQDTDLLPWAVSQLDVGELTRHVERAEGQVLDTAIGRADDLGRLEADLNEPGALALVRRAIARQAEHLVQREALQDSREPSAIVTLREMGEVADDVRDLLSPILPHDGARVVRSLR